jgi:hypothetical protein
LKFKRARKRLMERKKRLRSTAGGVKATGAR